jgi:hypothetical protein
VSTTAEAFAALDSLIHENDELREDNLVLRAQLETARNKLHTANILAARRGW